MDNPPPRTEPRLLKPGQVAEILAISRTAAYRLLQSGELPAVRFAGCTVRVRESDLQTFITEHVRGQTGAEHD